MTTVVPFRRGGPPPDPRTTSIVVAGAAGGAGATTTALGLTAALTATGDIAVAVVDGTSDGGNLIDRAAARPAPASGARSLTTGLDVDTALTSSGAVTLARLTDRIDLGLLDHVLAGRGAARVFDVGTALDSPRVGSIRRTAAVVLTCTARAEPLTRLRAVLYRIRCTYGDDALARTTVAITHTVPTAVVDLDPIRTALTPLLAGLTEVPFDAALAAPGLLDHRRIHPAVAAAWADIAAAAIGATTTDTRSVREDNAR